MKHLFVLFLLLGVSFAQIFPQPTAPPSPPPPPVIPGEPVDTAQPVPPVPLPTVTEETIATVPPGEEVLTVCDSDECCEQLILQRPTLQLQLQETLRFNSRCVNGGLHCIVGTGCEICSNVTETLPPKPIPTPPPTPPGTEPQPLPIPMPPQQPIPTQLEETLTRPQCEAVLSCGTQECCDALAGEAGSSLVVSQRCLLEGERCYERSGCERCSDTLEEGLAPCDLTAQCTDQICCSSRAFPNPQTGLGYYAYDERCIGQDIASPFCVGNSGCLLCFNQIEGVSEEISNVNHLPLCPELTAAGDEITPLAAVNSASSIAGVFLGGLSSLCALAF